MAGTGRPYSFGMTIRWRAGDSPGRVWVIAVVVLLVLGIGTAFALGAFDGDDTPEPTQPAAVVTTEAMAVTTPASTTSLAPVTTAAGEDPLCVAHAVLTVAVDGHLPVDGPEDLEIVQTATLDFYTEAVDHVEPPERDAFSEFLTYQQASYDHSESFDWNPSPPLGDLLDNPPPTPPQGATAVVIQVLEERCDVAITIE